MAMIRFLLKIPAVLLMLICRIITLAIDLAAKVSCLILGPITVFILGCAIYTICRQAWSQTFLLALIEGFCLAALFGAGIISTEIGILGERLGEFIRT